MNEPKMPNEPEASLLQTESEKKQAALTNGIVYIFFSVLLGLIIFSDLFDSFITDELMIELGEDPQAYLAESDDPWGYLIILGGLLFSIAMTIYSSYLYINTEDSDGKTPTAKKYEREMKQDQLESNAVISGVVGGLAFIGIAILIGNHFYEQCFDAIYHLGEYKCLSDESVLKNAECCTTKYSWQAWCCGLPFALIGIGIIGASLSAEEKIIEHVEVRTPEQERRAKFNRKLDQLISELDNPIDIFGESLNIIEASRRREEVIDELVKIGDKKAIGPLIKTAKKSDFYKGRDLLSDTRYSAIEALGKIGDESAIETLIEALSDQNKDIRGCAARSLDKLGWDPNL